MPLNVELRRVSEGVLSSPALDPRRPWFGGGPFPLSALPMLLRLLRRSILLTLLRRAAGGVYPSLDPADDLATRNTLPLCAEPSSDEPPLLEKERGVDDGRRRRPNRGCGPSPSSSPAAARAA